MKGILKGASACFKERGISGSQWAFIAERVGVPIENLKKLFKTKDQLAMAVHGYELELLKMEYFKRMPNASLEEGITFIMKTRFEFVENNLERTALFFSKALSGREPWSGKLTQMVWQLSIEFVTLFEKSIRDGDLSKDVDTNIAVRALTSFYLTGIVSGLRSGDFNVESVWDFVGPQVKMLLDGLEK